MTRLEDLPTHVKNKLQAAGAVDFTLKGPPATAKAFRIECPGCRRIIVRGLLPMPTPWPVDVDVRPLSRYSEALALLAGRRTYNLAWRYNALEISRRGPWSYAQPDTPAKTDIVAGHSCGQLPDWPTQTTRIPPLHAPAVPTSTGEAPF